MKKFYDMLWTRRLSFVLVFCLGFLSWPGFTNAQVSSNEEVTVTNPLDGAYGGDQGSSFFILTDTTYGSHEESFVRVEISDLSATADYGGVDLRIYKVPQPLEFLAKQKNLHQVKIKTQDKGEGLVNLLITWWDQFFADTRKFWRQLFTKEAKQAVTAQSPSLKTHPQSKQPTPLVLSNRFAPIAGLEMLDQMRYPVATAKNIDPTKGVKLEGSSSNFLNQVNGNVNVPLGQLSPGLYLVEGIIGQYRATTLLFVTDVVAITKNSGQQMMVWTADRQSGKAVANVDLSWTDGSGVLQTATSDSSGRALFERSSPEHTYILGQDAEGGVFVSENFFYDSEIYNTKLYAFTDRPLYRPGDTVFVKMLGREFISSSQSKPISSGLANLEVMDPNGTVLVKQSVHMDAQQGADSSFVLPQNAQAGGYDMRIQINQDWYSASFRVAQYIKPHFDIHLTPAKNGFKTKEPVEAQLQLTYANGKPVANASVEISVRAQQMSVVEGNLEYSGLFPLKIQSETLTSDNKGRVQLKLPAADQPSRYVVTALATDGAAYRVKMSRELLIERAATSYQLMTAEKFTPVQQPVPFQLLPAKNQLPDSATANKQMTWQWIRLEDQSKESGRVKDAHFTLQFKQSGSYMIFVRDQDDNMLAATSHWVSGEGLKVNPGTIEVVFNKNQYQIGDKAQALITFPQAIEQALLTLERDKVENTAVLGLMSSDWMTAEKLNARQWRVQLPVQANYAPNMTLSVAYVANGTYAFQNAGLKVLQPSIDLSVKADKQVYAPGDTVNLEVKTSYLGQPISSALSLSVVDEMIYALQPEIAPSLTEFFYHPRRNNVRTSSSLNFISYDLATNAISKSPQRSEVNDRSVKLQERPRRDNQDTAAWMPQLKTDANGYLKVQFKMPDSLTRWRITARAMNEAGLVGQNTAWLKSDKGIYAKWTSETWLRENDQAEWSVVVFNQTSSEQEIEWTVSRVAAPLNGVPAVAIASASNTRNDATTKLASASTKVLSKAAVQLQAGANFIKIPVKANDLNVNQSIQIEIKKDGRLIDSLLTPVNKIPVQVASQRSQTIVMSSASQSLQLPSDARQVQLQWMSQEQSGLYQAIDDLINYPYGCTEQTASRLIPYTLALELGRAEMTPVTVQNLETGLLDARIRLISMAGNNGYFGWWNDHDQTNPFVTFYAYYADFKASQTLKIQLPAQYGHTLLDLYAQSVKELSLVQRALVLSWMLEMGLPVRTPVEGLMLALAEKSAASAFEKDNLDANDSLAFQKKNSYLNFAFATVLTRHIASQVGLTWSSAIDATAALTYLQNHSQNIMVKGLLWLVDSMPNPVLLSANKSALPLDSQSSSLQSLLYSIRNEHATLDRAMALVWIHQAAKWSQKKIQSNTESMPAPWQKKFSPTGQVVWHYPDGKPLSTLVRPEGLPINAVAVLRYTSKINPASQLPMTLSRHLYRVVSKGAYFAQEESPYLSDRFSGLEKKDEIKNSNGRVKMQLELVQPGQVLKADELYLDEIRIRTDRNLSYGLIEVPLPPGAHAEASTWGIYFDKGQALEAARFEEMPGAYVIPIDQLKKSDKSSSTIRHLVRWGQTGQYQLPAIRYWLMYQSGQQAWEAQPNWSRMKIE